MVLPSLILRLEHLAQPDTPPGAATAAAVADAASPAEDDAAAEPFPAGPPVGAPPVTSDVGPDHEPPRLRRVVDVAAPERLSTASPLSRWSAAVAAAHDPCFVLDLNGVVVSISVAAVELLGCGDVAIIGRHVLEVVDLADLETGASHPDYATRITPLAVLDGPGLGRSLVRVRHPDGTLVMLDVSAAPVHDVNGSLLGSVTFLAPIPTR